MHCARTLCVSEFACVRANRRQTRRRRRDGRQVAVVVVVRARGDGSAPVALMMDVRTDGCGGQTDRQAARYLNYIHG